MSEKTDDAGSPWYQDGLAFLSNAVGTFGAAYLENERAEAAGTAGQVPTGTGDTERTAQVVPIYRPPAAGPQVPVSTAPAAAAPGMFDFIPAQYRPAVGIGAVLVLLLLVKGGRK
jgi:hypothetical protein